MSFYQCFLSTHFATKAVPVKCRSMPPRLDQVSAILEIQTRTHTSAKQHKTHLSRINISGISVHDLVNIYMANTIRETTVAFIIWL